MMLFEDMPMWLQIAVFCAAFAVLVAVQFSMKLGQKGNTLMTAIMAASLLLCAAKMGLGPATIFSLAFAAGFAFLAAQARGMKISRV